MLSNWCFDIAVMLFSCRRGSAVLVISTSFNEDAVMTMLSLCLGALSSWYNVMLSFCRGAVVMLPCDADVTLSFAHVVLLVTRFCCDFCRGEIALFGLGLFLFGPSFSSFCSGAVRSCYTCPPGSPAHRFCLRFVAGIFLQPRLNAKY